LNLIPPTGWQKVYGMRVETELPTRRSPAFAIRYQHSGLTARRFVDLGRTESMMCSATGR